MPLENDIPLKCAGKENRPQLRVPDTACTGNPAKRLCADLNRGGILTAQFEKSCPQLRSISNATNPEQHGGARKYEESPCYIPFSTTTTSPPSSTTKTSEFKAGHSSFVAHNLDKRPPGCEEQSDNSRVETSSRTGNSGDAVGAVNMPDKSRLGHGNHVDRSLCIRANSMESNAVNQNIERRKSCGVSSASSPVENIEVTNQRINDKSSLHKPDSINDSEHMLAARNKQLLSKDVDKGENSGRSAAGSSAGDFVTPKRKRKFPGPAGILPKLGPGKSLDIMSPAALNTTPSVTDQSPRDDSVILCSQSTDDIFSDTPWQTLLQDIGEDGQKLLKKFSISSTLLKAGKRQLAQGKAALIFGVIDTIESHGSEASVTIRDKSGRMQGTIHRDLFKEHESDLQIGTVLVLKQVSIISLSNRNHYLNITPSNLVVLYSGGQSSLRMLKFHGSQESLQSVLSALEKKAASLRHSLNNNVTMTPSSLTGSSRGSLTGSGMGTPQQLFSVPGNKPPINQQLFSPRTPVSGQRPFLRTPVPAEVRDVSVVDRNVSAYHRPGNTTPVQTYPGHGNSTPNAIFRPGINTSVNSSNMISQPGQEGTFLRTQNTNIRVVPVQNQHFSTSQCPINSSGNNFSPVISTGSSSHTANSNVSSISLQGPQQNTPRQGVSDTPTTAGKSRWKFKSPPSRTGSIPSSPNITGLAFKASDQVRNNIINRPSVSATVENVMVSNSGYSAVQSSIGNVTSSESRDQVNRSWQMNNQSFAQNTSGMGTRKSVDSGSTSAWAFKSSNVRNTVDETETLIPRGNSKAQVTEDNLWDDDLSDDLLSQLSEDFT